MVDNGNIGRFYKYVNNRLVAKTGVGLIKDQSRHMLHDDKDKAECFNRFFSYVFMRGNGIIPDIDEKVAANSFVDIVFTYEDVVKLLKALKPKNSAGPDGLPLALLKKLAPSTAFPLMLIFQQSFQCAQIPTVWKSAIVTPVFKRA